MPDGYTETVSPQALEELLQLIEKLRKETTKPERL